MFYPYKKVPFTLTTLFLRIAVCAYSVARLYLTLCDPRSWPGSSVHGISHARILEWVAIAYSSDYHQVQLKTSLVVASKHALDVRSLFGSSQFPQEDPCSHHADSSDARRWIVWWIEAVVCPHQSPQVSTTLKQEGLAFYAWRQPHCIWTHGHPSSQGKWGAIITCSSIVTNEIPKETICRHLF